MTNCFLTFKKIYKGELSGLLKIKDNKCIPCEDESVNRLVANRQMLMIGHLHKVISVTLLCHKVPTEGAIS